MSGDNLIEYKIEGMEKILTAIKAENLLAQPVKNFFERATKEVEGAAKELTPIDTGRLRASITSSIDSTPVPLWGKVGTNVFYAPYIEEGTRPHFPPPAALATWSRRHGIPAFVVCLKIAKYGTKGRHMLRQGLEKSKGRITEFIDLMAREIAQRWQ